MCAELQSVVTSLIDVLSPAICRHCGLIVRGGAWAPLLCADCGEAFPLHDDAVAAPYPIARAWAYAAFEGPARRLLIDLKYDGVLRAGRVIGAGMATAPCGMSALAIANPPLSHHCSAQDARVRAVTQSRPMARGPCQARYRAWSMRSIVAVAAALPAKPKLPPSISSPAPISPP